RDEVSFWYLANRLGRRFLHEVEVVLGVPEPLGAGLWRSRALGRMIFWVSSRDLPVEEDTLPLHLVSREPPATELSVAQLVVEQPQLQARYGGWVATLHPRAWEEVETMARTARKDLEIDLRPAIRVLGLDYVLEQVGIDRLIDKIGVNELLEHVGEKEMVKRIGIDRFLASLSASERRELKRRLQ
ncbi:MAG TPA: hypothetical protein VFA18_02850, partial [Gemmataceae bacterium]|nr:hypothetical protein [Gemmataceae bacterium]